MSDCACEYMCMHLCLCVYVCECVWWCEGVYVFVLTCEYDCVCQQWLPHVCRVQPHRYRKALCREVPILSLS